MIKYTIAREPLTHEDAAILLRQPHHGMWHQELLARAERSELYGVILADAAERKWPGWHPQRIGGDCDLCGEWAGHLIDGACEGCADRLTNEQQLLGAQQ